MEKDDKGSTMIRMGVSGWMFLLVPAYPGCPGSKAVKRSLLFECMWLLSMLWCYLFYVRNSIWREKNWILVLACSLSGVRSQRCNDLQMASLTQLSTKRRINHSANCAMACPPQVWMHFGIVAGIWYYAVRLLWTYVTCFAQFIVHDEKMHWTRHFQFMMIWSNISIFYRALAPMAFGTWPPNA